MARFDHSEAVLLLNPKLLESETAKPSNLTTGWDDIKWWFTSGHLFGNDLVKAKPATISETLKGLAGKNAPHTDPTLNHLKNLQKPRATPHVKLTVEQKAGANVNVSANALGR